MGPLYHFRGHHRLVGFFGKLFEDIEQYLQPHIRADRADFDAGRTDMPPISSYNMRVRADSLRIISEPTDPADVEAWVQSR